MPNPSEKHRLFFEYLLISPSYQLAHEFVNALLSVEHPAPPDDFDEVLNFYARCGSVFDISFEQWWSERGANLFAYSNDSKRVIPYRVDMSKSVKDLVVEFKDFLTMATESRRVASSGPSLNLLSSKVHKKTLRSRLGLVMDKARRDAVGKPLTNWELAIFSGLESSQLNGLAIGMKLSGKNEAKRVYAGMWVSRLIKEAGSIAEQAARGVFPKPERIPTMLDLDFPKIDAYSRMALKHYVKNVREKRANSKLTNKAFYRKLLPADVRAKIKIRELVDEKVKLTIKKMERDRIANDY